MRVWGFEGSSYRILLTFGTMSKRVQVGLGLCSYLSYVGLFITEAGKQGAEWGGGEREGREGEGAGGGTNSCFACRVEDFGRVSAHEEPRKLHLMMLRA